MRQSYCIPGKLAAKRSGSKTTNVYFRRDTYRTLRDTTAVPVIAAGKVIFNNRFADILTASRKVLV